MKHNRIIVVATALILLFSVAVYVYVSTGGTDYSKNAPEETVVPTTTYSIEDVSAHNSKDDCWQAIDGIVYDFTSYLASDEHPGGGAMIKDCGTDASFTYKNNPPHSEYARSLMPPYAIGVLE